MWIFHAPWILASQNLIVYGLSSEKGIVARAQVIFVIIFIKIVAVIFALLPFILIFIAIPTRRITSRESPI